MQRLPLFPLGTVLVPGLVMPLRVFEDRYRALVRDLMAQPEHERFFGVVAIRSGHEVGTGNATAMYEVGCTALVREVDELPDGGYDLVVSGAVRFRLHDVDPAPPTPYPSGWVTPLVEQDHDPSPELAHLSDRVAARFAAYRDQVGSPPLELPDSPRVLSYLVAAGTALDVADRQGLLEAPDTTRRLESELRLLRREQLLWDALHAVPSSAPPASSGAN
ncbi:LON peptidase substrate-binding domain-containing protein [Thalassiella azotivora]